MYQIFSSSRLSEQKLTGLPQFVGKWSMVVTSKEGDRGTSGGMRGACASRRSYARHFQLSPHALQLAGLLHLLFLLPSLLEPLKI